MVLDELGSLEPVEFPQAETPNDASVDDAKVAQAQRILDILPQSVRDSLATYRDKVETSEVDNPTIDLDAVTLQELTLASLGTIGEKVSTEGFNVQVLQKERRDNEAAEDVMRIHADNLSFTIPEDLEERLRNVDKIPDVAKPLIASAFKGLPMRLENVDVNFTNQTDADGKTIIGYDSIGPDLKIVPQGNMAQNVIVRGLLKRYPNAVQNFVGSTFSGSRVNDEITNVLLLPNVFGNVATNVNLRINPTGVSATFAKRPAVTSPKAA